MMQHIRLRDWARADKDRSFEIRYTSCGVKHPWAVDLSNDATQQAVHIDCCVSLKEAVDRALAKAESINLKHLTEGRI